MSEVLGAIEGKYEVLARLGGGGMGETFLVRHRHLDQARVVKVMRPELVGDDDLRARFLREARIASRIEHPRIARLHDFEVAPDGSAFLVLEHVPGYALSELAGGAPLAAAAVAEIGLQVVEALRHLHDAGFLHRDVAPDNVMAFVDERGAPGIKLIDLGIAKALQPSTLIAGTRGDAFVGKPLYASPEQIRTDPLDPRSDYYSLGAMLYELATGVFPYRYTNLASLISAHLHSAPLPFAQTDPGGRVPAPLRATLLALLDKDPERRLDSPDRLAIQLALVAAEDGPCALAAAIGAARARLGARDASSRAGGAAHATLQGRLDRQFRGPTGAGEAAAEEVAPTVLFGARGGAAPAPAPAAAPAAVAATAAAWARRVSGRYPVLGRPRARWAVSALTGGLAFLVLLILVFWIVGKVPGDRPFQAVVYSVPENVRAALGLASTYGWQSTVAAQLFSLTALLPGLAAGFVGARAAARGWPVWLGALLGALVAFAFLIPYLPPVGTYYHHDPFPLLATVYLAAGAVAARLGGWLAALLRRA